METGANGIEAGRTPPPGAVGPGAIVVLLWFMPLAGTQSGPDMQCKPVVEDRADQGRLRVRPHADAFLQCTLTREELASLLREFLHRPEHGAIRYQSLFLGRLVEYPWLSRYLAEQATVDPIWEAIGRRAQDGEINAFVRAIFTSADAIALLRALLDGTAYTVTGVSVEKVLVAPANSIGWLENSRTDLVPYDAMIHLNLQKE